MRFLNVLRNYRNNLFDDPSKRLLKVELDSSALIHNVRRFKAIFPRHYLAAVLKSNAYGHGLKEVGRFLDKRNEVDCFVVDSLIEARTLRDSGAKKPIIILGYVPQNAINQLKKIRDVIFIVNSKEQAILLRDKINFKLRVHIKVDTGMNRHGISISDLVPVIGILHSNKHIHIEGMMSHLADADGLSGVPTQMQIQQWRAAMGIYRKIIGHTKGIFHFAATAGTRYASMAENNLIRAGIGMYGFDNTQDNRLGVKPVLSFWSKISNIKQIKKGEKVGYNFTYTAPKDMMIAVVPCGYYEGIPRSLSNAGHFYYKDTPLPIIGRISMNLTVVDVSDVKEPLHLEDEVEVYSSDPDKLNSVENVAKLCDTIPYEILVRLAPTIKRVIK
jgi:alanine racemase